MEVENVSIQALGLQTRQTISKLLNPWTVGFSEKGFPSYWLGLYQCCQVPDQFSASFHTSKNPTDDVLQYWQGHDAENSTVHNLLRFLEDIDRFDVVDDIKETLERDLQNFNNKTSIATPDLSADRDIKTVDDQERYAKGFGPQMYNAYVLCADDVEDEHFAMRIVKKLEDEYGMKLCLGHRDLLPGVLEDEAVISLITERSDRLILILSPAFFDSPVNMYVTNVIQSYNLRKDLGRKLLPVLHKECESTPVLQSFYVLNYQRWLNKPHLFDFWEKLRSAIVLQPKSSARENTVSNSQSQEKASAAKRPSLGKFLGRISTFRRKRATPKEPQAAEKAKFSFRRLLRLRKTNNDRSEHRCDSEVSSGSKRRKEKKRKTAVAAEV